MLHLASQLRDLRRTVVTLMLLVLILVAAPWVGDAASAAQAAPPTDASLADPSRLAVAVVGAGLIGVLLFGVRLVATRRSRRP